MADVGVDPADADDPDLDYVDALVEEVRRLRLLSKLDIRHH